MQSEISVKYLIREIIRKVKIVIILGIVFGTIYLLCFGVSMAGKDSASQKYGSFSQIDVEKTGGIIIGDKTFYGADYDFSSENMAYVICDEVLSKVEQDESIKTYGLSIQEIRKMIHLKSLKPGSIVDINVVADNQKLANLICDKVVEYATQNFMSNGYEVEIMQKATSLGAVSIELRDNNMDPTTTHVIITQVEEINPDISMFDLVKQSILGFLAGMFITCLGVCIRFVFLNRLIYAEQIEEGTGIQYIGNFDDDNCYKHIYSSLCFENIEVPIVEFISLKNNGCIESVQNFARQMEKVGKKTLVVEYIEQDNENAETFSIEPKNSFDGAVIYDKWILINGFVEDIIRTIKQNYDLICFVSNDVKKNPMIKLISPFTDRTLVLLKPDTVKVKELYDLKLEYERIGLTINGALFLSNSK